MIIHYRDASSLIDEPTEHLWCWQIIVLPNGDRHFCGIRANGRTGRVSSRIVTFHAAMRTGMTASGRIYHLEGAPGEMRYLQSVVAVWCRFNQIDPAKVEIEDIDAI